MDNHLACLRCLQHTSAINDSTTAAATVSLVAQGCPEMFATVLCTQHSTRRPSGPVSELIMIN